ncbi:MAG: hypothetical protein M0T80_06235, partial [Actinomycetota bacterium]|nr:hypothetical protein [Actinomycetota bacterium]
KHRLAAWVRFLALSAARPELAPAALSVGRGSGGSQPAAMALLPPLGTDPAERAERATAELHRLVALADLGLRAPVPLACRTSAAWAEARHRGDDPDRARRVASDEWEGRYPVPGERDDPEHAEVFGAGARFEDLAGSPDFEALAVGLWQPLLAHERTGPASAAALAAAGAGWEVR